MSVNIQELDDIWEDLPSNQKAIHLPDTEAGFEFVANEAQSDAAEPIGVEGVSDMMASTEDVLPYTPGREPLASSDPVITKLPEPARERGPSPQDSGPGFNWERAATAFLDGSQGVAQYDARQDRRSAAMAQQAEAGRRRKLEDARELRDVEKHRTEMDIMKPLKAETARQKLSDAETKAEVAKQSHDPASVYSQTMRTSVAERLRAEGAIVSRRDPEAGKVLSNAAESMAKNDKMSALQVMEVAKMLGPVAQRALHAAHTEATEAMAQASLGVAQDRLAIDEEKHEITIRKPQERLVKEINSLSTGIKHMKQMIPMKQGVDTGPLMKFALKDLGLGKLDAFMSENRANLEAQAARVFNRETKELAGSAVSAGEWARIEPQIPGPGDDDRLFMTKLLKAIAISEEILAERRKEFQLTNGAPTDHSTVAAEQVAQLPPRKPAPRRTAPAPAPAPAPQAAGPDAAKVARARSIIADPNESPEKKAKAERWLKANGQ